MLLCWVMVTSTLGKSHPGWPVICVRWHLQLCCGLLWYTYARTIFF
jgi:hypothetical protein